MSVPWTIFTQNGDNWEEDMPNSKEIAERCKREVNQAENVEQLETALRYGLQAKKEGHLTPDDCADIRYLGFWRQVRFMKGL